MKIRKRIDIALIASLLSTLFMGCQPEVKKTTVIETEAVKTEAADVIEKSEEQNKEKSDIQTQSEPVTGAPKIVLKKDIHDFGQVGPGSSSVANFEFVNEGDATLLIKQVQSTCGCSKPALIKNGQRFNANAAFKEPIAFEPGQSGKVEVTFKAPQSKGGVTKHLYIVSNNPEITRAQLEIKAQVAVQVSITPETIDLKLDQENAGMPELVIESLDGREFSIKSATSSNRAITIPFDSSEKANKFSLKPQVDIEKFGNTTTGNIQVATTHSQSGRLMVRYTVKPMYELSNPRYFLQNINYEEPVLRDNLIRSNYGKKVEIESVTSRNGYMDIDSQEQDCNHLKLVIRITPPAKDAVTRRFISDVLTIKLKDGHSLDIRGTGYFKTK